MKKPEAKSVGPTAKRGRPRRAIVDASDEAETKLDRKRLKLALSLHDSTGSVPRVEKLLAISSDDLDYEIRRISATRKMRPFEAAFAAECALHTLKYGTLLQKAKCEPVIQSLRKTKEGRAIDPYWKMGDADFLERFIEALTQLLRKTQAGRSVDPSYNMRTAKLSLVELQHTLQHGTQVQQSKCKARIRLLRKTEEGRAVDLSGKMGDADFLERFMHHKAQLLRKTEEGRTVDPSGKMRDADFIERVAEAQTQMRIAKETAQLARREKARVNRFITPDEPDVSGLASLRYIVPLDPTTWPTLRDLKLATAIPERTIERIIAGLRPKRAEIRTLPLRRRHSGRGAWPKRYGPRLVIGVLQELMRRLPEFAISDVESERLREIAVTVKRSLASKLGYFRSIT